MRGIARGEALKAASSNGSGVIGGFVQGKVSGRPRGNVLLQFVKLRYLEFMRFDQVERRLAEAAFAELPGPDAQSSMAPRPRRFWVPGVVPRGARRAAGLALLYPRGDDTALLLTVRGAHLANHRGQVSLPGGAVEEGESIEDAALREAEEEVGLSRAAVAIRLQLTPLHIPVSSYVLHTVVATAAPPPDLRAAAGEVDRIIEVGLSSLASGTGLTFELREREGFAVEVPYFELGGAKLWGATAMVVSELLAVLGTPLDPWGRR
jgi:8-oxo-dGTP pyrophosphatase MutT (NUDIX family)